MISRRRLLAAAAVVPFVGVRHSESQAQQVATPTPLERLHERFAYVDVTRCEQGWWVWAGEPGQFGFRAATIDEACLGILASS